MQTWTPIQWNTMGMIPHECWGDHDDEGVARAAEVGGAPMAIFTGEDERAGYDPDDFDGMIRLGLHSDREIDDAAFRLCQALKYDTIPLAQTDEIRLGNVRLPKDISDMLVGVAEAYIERGKGTDGLVKYFRDASTWDRGTHVCCSIVDFVRRLRWVCGISYNGGKAIRLDITGQSREMIRRGLAGPQAWMWRHLDAAVNGKLA